MIIHTGAKLHAVVCRLRLRGDRGFSRIDGLVRTRQDLAERIQLAVQRKVRADMHEAPLAEVNRVLSDRKPATSTGESCSG